MTREKQLKILAGKQMRLMREAENKAQREYQMMLWAGFLAGLRLANAISRQEYDRYYNDLQELSERLNTA